LHVSAKAGKMVSFSVKGYRTITYGYPIIFKQVLVNEGGCYDDATGMFTTPVPGTYTFTASVGSNKKDEAAFAYLQLYGKDYGFIRASYNSTGSCSVSVQLSTGQKVCVKADRPSDYFYSSELFFTGALVQPQL
jgi:hypothetical protein